MLRDFAQHMLRFLRAQIQTRNWTLILSALLVGVYLTCCVHHYVANFGLSRNALTGLLVAATAIISIVLVLRSKLERFRSRQQAFLAVHGLFAAWTISVAWIDQPLWWFIGQFEWTQLQSPVALIAVATISLSVPLALAATLPIVCVPNGATVSPASTRATYFAWLSAGVGLAVLLLAPAIGIEVTRITGALCGIGIFFVVALRSSEASKSTQQHSEPATAQLTRFSAIAIYATLFAGGVAISLTNRITEQFLPASEWAYGTIIASMMFGYGMAWMWVWKEASQHEAWRAASWTLSCWSAAIALGFGLLLQVSLLLNAYVSQVWLLVVGRALLIAALATPVGFAIGRAGRSIRVWSIPLIVCGGTLADRWYLLQTIGVTWTLLGISWLAVAFIVSTQIQARSWPIGSRKLQGAWVFALLAITVGPFFVDGYQPSRAAKVLFDTNAFAAFRTGSEMWKLPFYDEGRCLQTVEGTRGTYSLWSYRGSQLQVRESGIPKSLLSRNPDLSPQFAAELTHAIVPLALHQSPRKVLILGATGGVQVASCLASPVPEIACVESDPALIDICKQTLSQHAYWSGYSQSQLEFVCLDPSLAVGAKRQRFDIIIDSPEHSSRIHSSPSFTKEYYQRVSRTLNEDGLYCQQFAFVDVGATTMSEILATLTTAFGQVAAVETAPGTILFLATNSDQGFERQNLLARLQAAHVRSILATAGWDWSTLLNLPTCEQFHIAQVLERKSPTVNSTSNGRLAFRMPLDVMRWGAKREEVHQMLANNSTRLLQWAGDVGTNQYIQNRLKEQRSKQRLVTVYPDEHWRYRATIKDQLKKRPKTVIQHVNHEPAKRKRHPEDERRMNYLKALGNASNPKPKLEELQAVAEFQHPYDPLISYFLHGEVAHIAAHTKPQPIKFELTHRLYKVYFSSSSDRSVRNLVAALKLLAKNPDVLADETERFDHMNALLQMLLIRWNNRRAIAPSSSQIVLQDLEQSISATELALESMSELHASTGLSDKDWEARESIMEKRLLRPLRTHRGRILPEHLKRSGKKKSHTLIQGRKDYALP